MALRLPCCWNNLAVMLAIPAHVTAGKQIFSEALAAGTMECFFLLIEQFRTQVYGLDHAGLLHTRD